MSLIISYNKRINQFFKEKHGVDYENASKTLKKIITSIKDLKIKAEIYSSWTSIFNNFSNNNLFSISYFF